MDYIRNSTNKTIGIKAYKCMSSKRKRRCKNYQIKFIGDISRSFYDIEICSISIPCLNYRYSYQ